MLVILNSARRSRTVVVTVEDDNADLLFRLVAHGVVEIQIVVGHNEFERSTPTTKSTRLEQN
jgi:hypothetical protein